MPLPLLSPPEPELDLIKLDHWSGPAGAPFPDGEFQNTPSPTVPTNFIINYVQNPGIETNLTGWTSSTTGGSATLTRITSGQLVGTASARLLSTNITSTQAFLSSSFRPAAVAGEYWSAQCIVKVDDATSDGTDLSVVFYDFSHNILSVINGYDVGAVVLSTTASTTLRNVGALAPAGTAFAGPMIRQRAGGTDSADMTFDSVILVKQPWLSTYFDGSSTESGWGGTTNNSVSYRREGDYNSFPPGVDWAINHTGDPNTMADYDSVSDPAMLLNYARAYSRH